MSTQQKSRSFALLKGGDKQGQEQQLASRLVIIQSKRFFLDVKQNRRGRFIKVAEISADGRRSQIFLALSTAGELKDHLSSFSLYYSNLGPSAKEEGQSGVVKLKSEMIVKEHRRYFLDLGENSRGRFLRVSQISSWDDVRFQITIPAQGLVEFKDCLTDLLEQFGVQDGGFQRLLPPSRSCRVENKSFYFDVGHNNRGVYMKVSEVQANFRTDITIPEKSWAKFRDIFDDCIDKLAEALEEDKKGGGKENLKPSSVADDGK
jgi:hypothetical protein